MTGLPLNIDIQQILLHVMNFVILAGGLYFLLYKPVRAFMDKRTSKYEELKASTESEYKKAEELEKLYQDKLKDAESEIRDIRTRAKKEAEDIIAEAKKSAEAEGKQILADAREKALKEHNRIIKSAKHDIIEMVIEAENKILHKEEKNDQ